MRMNPDSGKLFRLPALVHLLVEEVGDRFVVECDVCPRTVLLDKLHVFYQQQVIGRCDPEPADFGLSKITQE